MPKSSKYSSQGGGPGGDGGNASAIGSDAIAVGGRGGRGGNHRNATGGQGGDAYAETGYSSFGGNGGDANRLGRPALGGSAVDLNDISEDLSVERLRTLGLIDKYGLPTYGYGGSNRESWIIHDRELLCMNILIRLIDKKYPEMLDKVDCEYAMVNCDIDQEWWDLAFKLFPKEIHEIASFVIECDKI